MAGIGHIMACCDWSCPCTTSGGPIGFAATVTVAPPATCHEDCYLAERVYNGPQRGASLSKLGGETTCIFWVLDASNYHQVALIYNRARKKWYANQQGNRPGYPRYNFGGNEGAWPGDSPNQKDVTEHITCNEETGEISGTFDLDGKEPLLPGRRDCRGCTATVSVYKYW